MSQAALAAATNAIEPIIRLIALTLAQMRDAENSEPMVFGKLGKWPEDRSHFGVLVAVAVTHEC